MVVKIYGQGQLNDAASRYSPPVCIGAEKIVQWGNPDLDHISTSLRGAVEPDHPDGNAAGRAGT